MGMVFVGRAFGVEEEAHVNAWVGVSLGGFNHGLAVWSLANEETL